MKKGLIIQIRPGIGDLCLFLPYMQQIKQHNPDTDFTLITKKRTAAKEVLEYEKTINEIIYLEDPILNQTKSRVSNFFNLISFYKTNNFSKIYIMQFSLFWYLTAKFAAIKNIYTYGLFKKNVDIYLNALAKNKQWLNDENLSSHTQLNYPKKSKNNNIVIGIGSSGPTKKWPTENYISLIKEINNKETTFYLAGGDNEVEVSIANQIINSLNEYKIISLCKLSIKEVLKTISNCKLYIGNDTGFMHLSAGLDIPSIGLFGDTPLSYAKYSKNIYPVIPANYKTVGHNSLAINKISCNSVFNEVKKFI